MDREIWRDPLALAMIAAWVNVEPDKLPPEMRAHTCKATAEAWGRVAKAAREFIDPVPKWIEVSQYVPSSSRDVLLFQDGWGISPVIVGRYQNGVWLSDCFNIDDEGQRPTHWKELDDTPPEEKEK